MDIESTVELSGGTALPRLGLGTFRSEEGRETRRAVRWALEAGYRHVDTAAAYGNEADVGAAIRESGVPREEVFVTTKLWNEAHGYDEALAAFDRSLERLGLDAVDLYLIHYPVAEGRLESWRALERILDEGRARAVGVSNYMVPHLRELLDRSDVAPAVNQIELHPFNYRSRRAVVDLCREHGIVLEGYAPLVKARRMEDDTLVEIGRGHAKTPAQVLVRWALQHDLVSIPKSVHRERIQENADVFDFELSSAEMESLDDLDEDLVTSWDPRETE